MKLRTIAMCVLIISSLGSGVTLADTHDENGENAQEEATEEPQKVQEITPHTTLTDYTFDVDNETVYLYFESDAKEYLTLTDAYLDPEKEVQEVHQRRIQTDTKEEFRVRFDVSLINDKMGVTITGGHGLYAVVWAEPGFTLTSSYSAVQTIIFFLVGASIGVTTVLMVAFKRRIELSEDVEREL